MLYGAMRVILVDDGPLANLYLDRLPAEQTAAVDTAFVPQGGAAPQRYLGSSPVVGGPVGVSHDGGVLWHRTAVQFRVRGEDPEAPATVAAVADAIRDVLVQFADSSVVRAGEKIVRCDVTTAPHYYNQDKQERPIMAVSFEVWHRPA